MMDELIFSFRFAAIGIAIVFSALIIIAASIHYTARIDKYFQTRQKSEKKDDHKKAEVSTIDNTSLVLITAAVATMIEGRFYIKKVQRLMPGNHINSPWANQGLAILHGSHVVRNKFDNKG